MMVGVNCLGLLAMGAVCEEKAEAWASPASPREKKGWAQDLSGGKAGKGKGSLRDSWCLASSRVLQPGATTTQLDL